MAVTRHQNWLPQLYFIFANQKLGLRDKWLKLFLNCQMITLLRHRVSMASRVNSTSLALIRLLVVFKTKLSRQPKSGAHKYDIERWVLEIKKREGVFKVLIVFRSEDNKPHLALQARRSMSSIVPLVQLVLQTVSMAECNWLVVKRMVAVVAEIS